jgi:hypothetical protein
MMDSPTNLDSRLILANFSNADSRIIIKLIPKVEDNLVRGKITSLLVVVRSESH